MGDECYGKINRNYSLFDLLIIVIKTGGARDIAQW